MAVILQTRCFQMENCEPDLSFSNYFELDCFRWLYIYGHICNFLSRYAQLKEYILLQSEQPGIGTKWKTKGPREQDWSCDEVIQMSGALWTDKYLQVVMTSQNVDHQKLQILLNSLASGGWLNPQIRKFQTHSVQR